MYLEALIFFVFFTGIFALFEVFYFEQELKKKIKFMSWQTYWKLHPLIPALAVLLFTKELLLSAAVYFAFTVLQDITYMTFAKLLGSDTSYANQDWLKRFRNTNIPEYYITNSIIASVLFIAWLLVGI